MTSKLYSMIEAKLMENKARSAWAKGVRQYSCELLENLNNLDDDDLQSLGMVTKALLNGAQNWEQYSWGGSSLIYNYEIAERLCNPSELKRTRNGERRPNKDEEWLDTQARALFQAAYAVEQAVKEVVG